MSDQSDKPDRSGTYSVGYGKPPQSGRFKPGESGNPKGRPAKPKVVQPKHVFASEPTARALQVEADRVISLMVGRKRMRMTVRDAAVRTLATNAIKGNRFAAKLFLDELTEAEALERTVTQAEIDAMQEHKSQWAADLEYSELYDIPLKAPIPHPEDIHFDRTTNRIVVRGPKNAKEKREWDKFLLQRDKDIELIGSCRRAAKHDHQSAVAWRGALHEVQLVLDRRNSKLPPRYRLEADDVFDASGVRRRSTSADPVPDQTFDNSD